MKVHSPRWQDTRFVLRSGKALSQSCAEIAIHFRCIPSYLGSSSKGIEPNVLRVGLMQPYVLLDTVVNGADFSSVKSQLEMESAPPTREAYANLIVEMLNRNTPPARSRLDLRNNQSSDSTTVMVTVT